MSEAAEVIAKLFDAGVEPGLVALVAKALANAAKGASDAGKKARNARHYQVRKDRKTAESVLIPTESVATESVLKRLNSDVSKTPLAHVEDNLSRLVDTGKQGERESASDARDRLSDVRRAAGDALADLAKSSGIASLHPLTSLTAETPPCDWRTDVLPAIESAAAWHRAQDGPGSMKTWTVAVRQARRNRDNRLNPPSQKPHERPDGSSKQSANLADSLAGYEAAARHGAQR